jgi:CHAT domain-containing protein
MLILSACKTATGDSREVLGIAGAMVQSGARSAIATLWSVDDQASVLFAKTFYAELAQPGISRAEALRRAQVALLERYPGRPRYWAPYVLVGSWR